MGWITSVSTVLEMIIRGFLLIILLVVGTVLVIGLFRLERSTSKSITIASFTDTGTNTREEKSRGLGHEIADALEFEILRIAQLHTLTNPWGSPRAPFAPDDGSPDRRAGGGDDQFGWH